MFVFRSLCENFLRAFFPPSFQTTGQLVVRSATEKTCLQPLKFPWVYGVSTVEKVPKFPNVPTGKREAPKSIFPVLARLNLWILRFQGGGLIWLTWLSLNFVEDQANPQRWKRSWYWDQHLRLGYLLFHWRARAPYTSYDFFEWRHKCGVGRRYVETDLISFMVAPLGHMLLIARFQAAKNKWQHRGNAKWWQKLHSLRLMKGCSSAQRTSSSYSHTLEPCIPDPLRNSKTFWWQEMKRGNINTVTSSYTPEN